MTSWFATRASRRRCREKQQEREVEIAEAQQILDKLSNELAITKKVNELGDMSARELCAALVKKQYTSLQAVTVLGIRALSAQRQVNCLTDLCINEAIEEARRMDETLTKQGPVGPLHGLPISVKDSVIVRGAPTSMGCSSMAQYRHPRDSMFIECLRRAGAIPYVKTNVPQTLMTFESYNPVYGRTLNPHNDKVFPGGSSGGESALLASKGSIIGIGTDIGGSVRIPAHCCGIYSLKPTAFRVPLGELSGHEATQELIPVSVGPMARDVDSLEVLMKALIDQEPWTLDAGCMPMPWQTWQPPTKLCLGYFTYNGFLPAAPACQRAVNIAVEKLRAAGHEVVEFEPPNVFEAFIVYLRLLFADGFKALREILGADERDSSIRPTMELVEASALSHRISVWIARYWHRDPQLASMLEASRTTPTPHELSVLLGERNRYRNEFLKATRESAQRQCGRPFDAIICPGFGTPGMPHGSAGDIFYVVVYTALQNLLDVSAGAIPVTKVDAQLDGQVDNVSWQGEGVPISHLEQRVRNYYDVNVLDGAPVGIQVFAERFTEERVLGCMRIIDACINGKK